MDKTWVLTREYPNCTHFLCGPIIILSLYICNQTLSFPLNPWPNTTSPLPTFLPSLQISTYSLFLLRRTPTHPTFPSIRTWIVLQTSLLRRTLSFAETSVFRLPSNQSPIFTGAMNSDESGGAESVLLGLFPDEGKGDHHSLPSCSFAHALNSCHAYPREINTLIVSLIRNKYVNQHLSNNLITNNHLIWFTKFGLSNITLCKIKCFYKKNDFGN